jgi:PAS domain S-box-containing protein/putative nucleotidyltransferase with HDIG domain
MMNEDDLYNSRVIKTFVEYLEANYPELDMRSVLESARITVYQLNDEGHWFNQDQVDRFHETVVKLTGNENIASEAGRYAPFSKASGAMPHYVSGFLTPGAAYLFMGKLYNQVSRACLLETRSLKKNQVDITVRMKPGVQEKPYQCENRKGMFEGVSKLLTGKLAHIDHPVCIHKGGNHCQYIITWEQTQSSAWKRLLRYVLLVLLPVWAVIPFILPMQLTLALSLVALTALFGMFLRVYNLERRELLGIIKNTGNIAENLMEQINIRYNDAVLIKDIGQYASSILDTDLLLKYFLSTIEKRLDFGRGMVMLASNDRTRLEYTAGYGYSPEHEDFIRRTEFSLNNPQSRGAFVVSFKKQIPFLINNVEEIANDLSPRSLDFVKRMGTRSFICVPIIYEGRAEGVLAVDNLRSNRPLNETDISLLMGIAPQIGISINNARVYEKLREREKRFRTLAEGAPDIIFTLDPHGDLTYVNPAWERILSQGEKEIVGQNLTDLVQEQDAHLLSLLIKRVREDKVVLRDILLTIAGRSGEEHNFSFNCAPNVDSSGQVVGLVGIFKDVTDLKRSEIELKKSYEKLQLAMSSTISIISLIAESRDPYTAGHQRSVANLATAIARELGLADERVQIIRMAGLIHDLGKIKVPAEILSKPGKLTESEFNLIKSHPETGYQILMKVDFSPSIAEIIYQHHERLDGTGYPRMITGEQILMEARIITVADVVEAMAGHRPYRPGLGIDKALEEIKTHSGVVYDANAVDACVALFSTKRFQFDTSVEE